MLHGIEGGEAILSTDILRYYQVVPSLRKLKGNKSMLRPEQIKSLEILSKFVADTPKDELQALIQEFEELSIEGPTFDQYLNSIDEEIALTHPCFENIYDVFTGWDDDLLLSISPPNQIMITNKKDPEKFSGSFFCIHLSHGRRTECTI